MQPPDCWDVLSNPGGAHSRALSQVHVESTCGPSGIEPTPGFEPGTLRLQGGCTNRLCYVGKTLTSVPVHHGRSTFFFRITTAIVSRHPVDLEILLTGCPEQSPSTEMK